MRSFIFLIVILMMRKCLVSAELVDLSTDWILINEPKNISIANLTLPTSVHSILHRAGLIDDPLLGYNDLKLRWILLDNNWTFQKRFKLKNPHSDSLINLEFDSIDTIASVYLNEKFILRARNQFVKYELFNMSKYLLYGEEDMNLMEVRFLSSVEQAEYLSKVYAYREPVDCPPSVQNGECHVNFIRKQQCSFSWDWGPAFAPIGLNNVHLNFIRNFDFNFSASVYPSLKGSISQFTIDLTLRILTHSNFNNCLVKIAISEINFEHFEKIELNNVKNFHRFKVFVNSEKNFFNLWWPNENGPQCLYNLTVDLLIEDEWVNRTRKIGFRSVELVEEEINFNSSDGLTFYFRINNEEMFLKGTNWIPADLFQEKITDVYLRWLFRSMIDAGMNVVRVWGGGVYERDLFYELADELGVLVWQDFMFACSLYPSNSDFVENVNEEVEYQLDRLRHHASVLIWSANNENEAALATDWYNTQVDRDIYDSDYRKLYVENIKRLVDEKDPVISRPFLSSSPTNGKDTIRQNWIATNPYDPHFGDLHFYNYEMNGWDFRQFPVPRFMSEFGVQSLPSYSTLAQAYKFPDDAEILSHLNQHRQHHTNGNQQILDQIQKNLNLPTNQPNNRTTKIDHFKSVIYLSQINQAMWLKTGSELYRRAKRLLDAETGDGLCMGTMYWQLNDVWQAPTWSSIEHGGKWKLAHYYVKNAYNSLILSPIVNETHLIVFAVSDRAKNSNVSFKMKIFSFDNFEAKFIKNFEYEIESFDAKIVLELQLEPILEFTNCELWNCFLKLESDFNVDNFLFFRTKIDSTYLKPANLKIDSIEKVSDDLFEIKLSTDQIAFFVQLDLELDDEIGRGGIVYGRFSDNGFQMSEPSKIITYQLFYSNFTFDEIFLRKVLTVKSLSDVYFI